DRDRPTARRAASAGNGARSRRARQGDRAGSNRETPPARWLSLGARQFRRIESRRDRTPRGRWRVALRHPEGGFAGEFALDDRACSTSATWGQTVRLGRTVLGHIVDPRTGKPLRRHAQVTVLAPSATVAEALSTALLVLGPRALHDVARDFGIDACWIDRLGIRTTPGFGIRRAA